MITRACIFCGGRPVTAEHVLPQWMLQVLRRDDRGVPDKVPIIRRVSVRGEPTIISRFETNRLFTLQPKCVCASCNNGWMSEVESRAKPFLEPMVEGKRRVELDAEAQNAISSWACLKAMTGHYSHGSFGPIATDWRKYFFDTRQPPDSWFIWVSAYYGNYPARFDSHQVSLVDLPPALTDIAPTEQGILTSLVIGYLAVKVFGIRKGNPGGPGADTLLRIWPPSPLILRWPPRVVISDEVVEYFFRMGLG